MRMDAENRLVGLMVSHDFSLLVGLMAILKAGDAFVPIDPKYPAERVDFIIRDCEIEILITEQEWLEIASQIAERNPSIQHLICVDCAEQAGGRTTGAQLHDYRDYMSATPSTVSTESDPDRLAYVI